MVFGYTSVRHASQQAAAASHGSDADYVFPREKRGYIALTDAWPASVFYGLTAMAHMVLTSRVKCAGKCEG